MKLCKKVSGKDSFFVLNEYKEASEKNSKSFLCIGLQGWVESHNFYDVAESQDFFLFKIFRIYLVYLLFVVYFPSALIPIAYAVAKFPEPVDWLLPLHAK